MSKNLSCDAGGGRSAGWLDLLDLPHAFEPICGEEKEKACVREFFFYSTDATWHRVSMYET